MNILTQDDNIYIYNLGEFIIGGATCPPTTDLCHHFYQNNYPGVVLKIILQRMLQYIIIIILFTNLIFCFRLFC